MYSLLTTCIRYPNFKKMFLEEFSLNNFSPGINKISFSFLIRKNCGNAKNFTEITIISKIKNNVKVVYQLSCFVGHPVLKSNL